MPYADDLYSGRVGAGSDGEADHLSPTDGYFASGSPGHAVPRIPNVMVTDPTVEQERAADDKSKAQEAASESSSAIRQSHQHHHYHPSNASSAARIYTPQTSASGSQPDTNAYSPSSPLLRSTLIQARPPSVYSEAPPAYSPSASSPLSATDSRFDSHRTYNTFGSIMPSSTEAEHDPLLARRPQSMGGRPDDEEAGVPHFWDTQVRSRLPSWLNWKTVVVGIILLAVAIGFISSSIQGIKGGDESTIKPSQPIGSSPAEPGTHRPVGDNAPIFKPISCRDAKFRFDDLVLGINAHSGKNVKFIEDYYENHGSYSLSVSGSVVVRQIKDGQQPELRAQIVTNYQDLHLNVLVDEDAQSMKVSVPRSLDNRLGQRPCLEIRATVWLPADAKLGELSVDVISLDIFTLSDFSAHLSSLMKLTSISGDIGSGVASPSSRLSIPSHGYEEPPYGYKIESREVRIHTTSGKIGGHFPLYDLLEIRSTSGDISASITPYNELKEAPRPATLTISTSSGVVHAEMPVDGSVKLPRRDYVTEIKTTSGSIRGHLIQGSQLRTETISGDHDLNLLPIIDLRTHSIADPVVLQSSTTSGHIYTMIMDPIWFGSAQSIPIREVSPHPYEPANGADPFLPPSLAVDTTGPTSTEVLNMIKANCATTSGDIVLKYPESWEGDIHATTTSGHLTVAGDGIKVIRQHNGWIGHELEARKGPEGGVKTDLKTLSSSIKFFVGLDYD